MHNLKKIREGLNLTQRDTAEKLNLAKTTYFNYESDRTQPDIETLKKIADCFDVSLDYLCDRQNKNLVQIDSLTEVQKQIIKEMRGLSDEQGYMLLGYLARIKERSIDDVISEIKKRD